VAYKQQERNFRKGNQTRAKERISTVKMRASALKGSGTLERSTSVAKKRQRPSAGKKVLVVKSNWPQADPKKR